MWIWVPCWDPLDFHLEVCGNLFGNDQWSYRISFRRQGIPGGATFDVGRGSAGIRLVTLVVETEGLVWELMHFQDFWDACFAEKIDFQSVLSWICQIFWQIKPDFRKDFQLEGGDPEGSPEFHKDFQPEGGHPAGRRLLKPHALRAGGTMVDIHFQMYMYTCIYVCVGIYIQLPCGPAPGTVPGLTGWVADWLTDWLTGCKTTGTTKRKHQKLCENHQKLRPRGLPEAPGGGLGIILAPRGAPEVSRGRPVTKKCRN